MKNRDTSHFKRQKQEQSKNRMCPYFYFRCGLTNAFTFIELLIALSIMAICFLPLMHMFSTALEASYSSNDLTTARYLAQEGMEKVKNLGLTQTQIRALGNVWEPPLNNKPLELNKRKWRTLRKIIPDTDPLVVYIQVYLVSDAQNISDSDKPFVELVTLLEDLDWAIIE